MERASAAEIRVLGCLIEKQRTTPETYPLSINALRLACNQATNRDPVVDYDEGTVRAAAERLGRRRWARFTSGRGSRATKYRHVLGEQLALADDELAVLCVLMLRGAQTPGELNARTARLHAFADLPAVEETLQRLMERELGAQLLPRPGQKERRYVQRLGEDEAAVRTAEAPRRVTSGEIPSPARLSDGSLALRHPRLEDVHAITEACQDPDIGRWTRLPSPYREQDARAWIDARPEASLGMLVVDAETDRLLGSVGLEEIHRERGRAEIGFWTAPWARRRGVALRSVRLMAGWAFDALALARVQALVREENVASQGVLERAGFTWEGLLRSYEEIKGQRWDIAIFSLLPEDLPASERPERSVV